jgi:hypothetical protein
MNKDEVLKMAIGQLQVLTNSFMATKEWVGTYTFDTTKETIDACKEALEQPAQEPLTRAQQVIRANNKALEQPAPEPVNIAYEKPTAWMWVKKSEQDGKKVFSYTFSRAKFGAYNIPVYIPPAEPLSYVDIDKCWKKSLEDIAPTPREVLVAFARAIEQALKEKNSV